MVSAHEIMNYATQDRASQFLRLKTAVQITQLSSDSRVVEAGGTGVERL